MRHILDNMNIAPSREPVAWMCSNVELMHKGYKKFSERCEGDWNIPLYTTPPAAAQKPVPIAALDQIVRQQEQIAQLEAEMNEQARQNGMGSEREAALMGKVARLEVSLSHSDNALNCAEEQITELKDAARMAIAALEKSAYRKDSDKVAEAIKQLSEALGEKECQ